MFTILSIHLESMKIHQGARETWERGPGLIWMDECFTENPVNCSWALGMVLGRLYCLKSMMCLCLPRLGWPRQTETLIWRCTLARSWTGTLSIHTEKFSIMAMNSLADVVGRARRQTRIRMRPHSQETVTGLAIKWRRVSESRNDFSVWNLGSELYKSWLLPLLALRPLGKLSRGDEWGPNRYDSNRSFLTRM